MHQNIYLDAPQVSTSACLESELSVDSCAYHGIVEQGWCDKQLRCGYQLVYSMSNGPSRASGSSIKGRKALKPRLWDVLDNIFGKDVLGSSCAFFFHVQFYLLSPRITDSLEANSCPMARIVWWTSISSKESSPSKLRSCSEERQWNRFSSAWTAWTEILQSWHVQNHQNCRFWWGRVSKAPLASPTWHLRKFRAAEWKKCCVTRVTSDVAAFGTSITRLQQYLAQVNVTTNLSTFQWIQGAIIESASHYDNDGDGKWSCPKLLHQWHQEKGWSSSGEAKIRQLDMIECTWMYHSL